MAKIGLLTRSEIKAGQPVRDRARKDCSSAVKAARSVGLAGVRKMNVRASSPEMPPSGASSPSIYVLGDYPTVEDDNAGEHWAGKSGTLFRRALGRVESVCRFNYVCRTRPEKNSKLTEYQVECFRQSVEDDIVATDPPVIVAVGKSALSWILPATSRASIEASRGRQFVGRVGDWIGWVVPVYDPAKVRQALLADRVSPPGEELEAALKRDLVLAAQLAEDGRRPERVDCSESALFAGVECLTGKRGDFDKLSHAVASFEGRAASVDIETNQLRPYGPVRPKILSIAFGDGAHVCSVALDHSGAVWAPRKRLNVRRLIRQLLRDDAERVFHNLSFDLEWLVDYFGEEISHGNWADTMQQAYTLDERSRGCQSLNYLCAQYFGVTLKELSDVDVKDLQAAKVDAVLKYNALDVKFTHRLYQAQARKLKSQGLSRIYRMQMDRVPATVLAQRKGLVVDIEYVRTLVDNYEERRKSVAAELEDVDEVKEYESRYGKLNPSSVQQVKRLFKEIVGSDAGQRGGKYSVDSDALKEIGGDAAELILELRSIDKILGTYIRRLLPGADDSYVYPDGKVHCNFNTTFTTTGRLSSDSPNCQNYPKRGSEAKKIRSAFVAPKGHTLFSVDYGQIEWRAIAVVSQDKYIMRSIWNGSDVHMEWARKLAKAYPQTVRDRHGSLDESAIKAFRSEVKNQMVFPACYRAKAGYIARMLDIPYKVFNPLFEDFWRTASGVRRWQAKMVRAYKKSGYVESPIGRRRRAPLTENEIVNHPIQSFASDIVVDAMSRLSRIAQEEDKPWLQPVLNIHDDLTFLFPDSELENAADRVIVEMLDIPFFDIFNVPVSVEAEMGPNWYEMETVGTFNSYDLLGLPDKPKIYER